MDELETLIGYKFKRRALLFEAMTTKSYANEHGLRSYDRLEFVGDAVLKLIVTVHLVRGSGLVYEGRLSAVRNMLVSNRQLATIAHALGISRFARAGKGDARGGFSEKTLADLVEALIGAIYEDGGFDEAARVLTWALAIVTPERDT